jgi:hypothetical protein
MPKPKYKCRYCGRIIAATKDMYFRRHNPVRGAKYQACPGSGTSCADPVHNH